MKSIKKCAFFAILLLSSFAFSQTTVFNVVKVPGSSPNSLTAINNDSLLVVNTGTSESYQVSTWGRLSGATVVGSIGNNSGGAGINISGEVVGAGDPDGLGNLQAFLWSPTAGVQWLGSLGGELSAATGINDAGSVVGMSYTATDTQHAFFWTQAGGMQDLTPDLTSIGGGTAEAVNSSNQVVGYYFPNGSRSTEGFIWTQAGGLQTVGPAGTIAYGINDSGTVVGQTLVANGYRHAFSWTASGGMQDLGTLGGAESSALSVNSSGWIVGTSLTSSGNGLPHAFLWTPSGGMQDVNVLAVLSTSQQGYAVQINDFGVITLSSSKGDSLLAPKMTETLTSSLNPSVLGQPVTFTATLTSIVGPPPDGETMQFTIGGKVYGSATLEGGVAQFTTSAIPVGSHVVVADYAGDTNYLPARYTGIAQVVNN